ncbi:MAG TPA: hypothetical protein VMS11_13095 [Solirubrobacterales bacterium]|nr:hypothetical protein [Solirubrobacterales bacterium]
MGRLSAAMPMALCAVLLWGCGSERLAETEPATSTAVEARAPSTTAEPEASGAAPFRFFSPTSFWNTTLAPDAALDPRSAPLVAAFDQEAEAELGAGRGPSISTTSYAVPIYTAAADQPTVEVKLTPPTPAPALQAAFAAVPLPPDAQASGGTDANLVVYQPASDRLWEFWRFRRGPEGPEASWGGAIEDVSRNPGVYGPEAWPGAKPWWGSSASSLSIAGGVISLEDLEAGVIDHALALAIPDVRAGVYSLPAQRADGTSESPSSLPEGAHLRLDPSLDLSTLQMPRITRLLAEAAQRYGIFVRDGAGVVHFFGQDPVSLGGPDPYAGEDGYFEGKWPTELLASFPWEHLQLLKMELRPDDD